MDKYPQQTSRTYSSYITETLYLLINKSPFPLPSRPITAIPVFDFMNLIVLDTSN